MSGIVGGRGGATVGGGSVRPERCADVEIGGGGEVRRVVGGGGGDSTSQNRPSHHKNKFL